MVVFFVFSAAPRGRKPFGWNQPALAGGVNLLAAPASIVGNEIALRIGRRRWIMLAMAGAGASGGGGGLAAPWGRGRGLGLLLAYSILRHAESGTLPARPGRAGPAGPVGAPDRPVSLGR